MRRLRWATWAALAAVMLAIAAVNDAIHPSPVILWLDAQAATEVTTGAEVAP